MRYVWVGPGAKVRIMFACVALIAAMVFIDGLLDSQPLRSLAGALVAWPFATFMIKGVPLPEQWVRTGHEQIGNALSMRPGATSNAFRWSMVVLGALIGASAFLGAYVMLSASLETIESLLPTAAHGIRRAQARDSEMLERLGYAGLFAFCGAVALFTLWKRAKT